MANFSGLQSKFMRMYESNPQYRMLSIDSAMAQMVQDGVLTKAEYDQLIKTSTFGFGFNSDLGDSVNFGGTTPVENYQRSPSGGIVTSKDKPKFGQLDNGYIDTATLPINYQIIPGEYTILTGNAYTAFSYLSDIFNEAETSFEQQRMNEGWVSDTINAMRGNINETDIVRLLEYFSLVKTKATREEVNEKLADTRNDIELLNAAMRGALVDGNGNNVDFETAFEATRGVKYSKEKIELCQQKAETYAQADMVHSGLEDLISNLEKFSHGSSDLQYAKEFNKNALKTLSILGLSDQGKINEALAETSKAVGYEIKLVKQGTKGKDYYGQDYAIMFKNKDGKFVPLTPEISRIISDDLISKIDATKKTLLGLPLDSSDKEVEKYLEQLKNDYEQSFKEAYGDKNISTLCEEYITAQQKGLMAVNLVANIALIATSMLTGGLTAGLMTGLLMTQPLQALEMFTDKNSETNLEAYGKMLLSQLPWMGAGMVMGKLGDLARSFVKLKGLQNLATNSGRSLDDLINIATNASKTGHKLPANLQKAMQITKRIADVSGMSVEMALDYAVTKFVQPEGATTQDWIMSFVGALAGSSLNKNISDFTKTKDVRAVELQQAFPDLKLSAEEAGKIISKIDEMVADGEWEKAVAKGADETTGIKGADEVAEVKTNAKNTTSKIEYKQTFTELTNQLSQEQKAYELYSDNAGNNVIIISKAGERPNPSAGIPFTYEVYRFDKNGNPSAEPLTGLSKKEADKYKLKNKQIVDNRPEKESGILASTILPVAGMIKNIADGLKKTDKGLQNNIKTVDLETAKAKILELCPQNNDYYLARLLEVCKVDDEISELLFNESISLLKKDIDIGRTIFIIEDFRTKDGKADIAMIEKCHELLENETDIDKVMSMLRYSKDKNGQFSEDLYKKLTSLKEQGYYAYEVLTACKIDGEVVEATWQKALELEALGYENSVISKIIEACQIKERQDRRTRVVGFSDELYSKAKSLFEEHKFEPRNIPSIITSCIVDGEFSQKHFERALNLHNKINEGYISRFVKYPDDALSFVLDIKNKYNINEYDLENIIAQCVDTIDGQTKTSQICVDKVNEMLSTLNIEVDKISYLLRASKLDGNIDLRLYDEVIKLKQAGFTEINMIINSLITKPSQEGGSSTVNYNLLEKAKQWKTEGISEISISNYEYILNSLEPDSYDLVLEYHKAGFGENQIHNLLNANSNLGDITLAEFKDTVFELKNLGLENDNLINTLQSIGLPTGFGIPRFKITKQNIEILKTLVQNDIKNPEHIFNLSKDNYVIKPDKLEVLYKRALDGISSDRLNIINYIESQHPDNKELINVLLEISKTVPNDFDSYKFSQLINSVKDAYLEGNSNLATSTIEALRSGINADDVMSILTKKYESYFMFQQIGNEAPKVIAEMKSKILDALKNNPDKSQEIFSIADRIFAFIMNGDLSKLDLCLKYPDKHSEILSSFYVLDSQGNRTRQMSLCAQDLIVKLEKAGILIDDVLTYTDFLCKNSGALHDTYTSEFINKIVELHNNKKLDNTTLAVIKTLSSKADNSIGLLDEMIRLKDEGLLSDINEDNATHFIYNLFVNHNSNASPGLRIFDNYKEILDFYIQNKEILTSKNLGQNGKPRTDIVDFLRVYNDKYTHADNKLILEELQPMIEIASKTGMDPSVLIGILGNDQLAELKPFIEKVDLEKYANEINFIFGEMTTYYGNARNSQFLNPNISAKEMEFLLDVQKLILEHSGKRYRPQIVDNMVIATLCKEQELSDEALNSLRYYIEMDFANPQYASQKLNIQAYNHLIKIYQNNPDYITKIEAIIFDKGFEDGYEMSFIRELSTEPKILSKQFELIDKIFDYTGDITNQKDYLRYKISVILKGAKKVEDIEVKIEAWEKLKTALEQRTAFDKVVDKFKQRNAVYNALEIVHGINNDNQKVIKILMSDKKYEPLLNYSDYITKDNVEAVEYILKNDKIKNLYNLRQFVATTQNQKFKADFIKENIDIIPEEYLCAITSCTNPINSNLLIKLLGDKNLNFPKDEIANIATSVNQSNIELITKLCTDKSLKFPVKNISEIALKTNYNNLEIATKLCTDKSLNCPPDNIANILSALSTINNSISMLTLSEKINTYSTIISLSPDVMKLFRKYANTDIEAKMSELALALGEKKDVITIPQEQQRLFVKNVLGNNNPIVEDVLKNFDFEQYGKEGLPLKYTREQFTNNIKNLISNLSQEEQNLVLEHFGLTEGIEGFDGILTNKPFDKPNTSQQLKDVAQKIQNEIELFTTRNQISTGDFQVDEVLNSLILGFPEFTSFIGKKQHETHAYSVDIHTLKVLQSAMNNPMYEALTNADKTILKFTALCHDFGKKGGIVDSGHASLSSEYCTAILDKFSFPQSMKDRIIDIVDNHHWFEAFNRNRATANDIIARCRRPGDLLIYEILAKADFENVSKEFHLGEKSNGAKTQAEFDSFINNRMQALDEALTTMYSRANLVFDTQFVKDGEYFPRETVEIDGEPVELKVLNLNKLKNNENLQKYGFSSGVTKDNARFVVHMTNPRTGDLESVLILTQNSLNQSAWSTSLIKASNNRTYCNRRFGFIFDVDQANISEAYYSNTGSGCGKGLETFKSILFDAKGAARTFVRDRLKQELTKKGIRLNDKEYAKLVKYLINKKHLTQITKDIKIGQYTIKAKDLVKALEVSRDALFEGGDIHSEIVPVNPRIKGLVAKVEKLEDCPEEFLKFAKAHNLPIILMKAAKDEVEY